MTHASSRDGILYLWLGVCSCAATVNRCTGRSLDTFSAPRYAVKVSPDKSSVHSNDGVGGHIATRTIWFSQKRFYKKENPTLKNKKIIFLPTYTTKGPNQKKECPWLETRYIRHHHISHTGGMTRTYRPRNPANTLQFLVLSEAQSFLRTAWTLFSTAVEIKVVRVAKKKGNHQKLLCYKKW